MPVSLVPYSRSCICDLNNFCIEKKLRSFLPNQVALKHFKSDI